MSITEKKNYGIDMCEGALLPKIIRFAIPLIFTGILQLLFNMADIIVVGRFVGTDALAAVGSNSTLIGLLTHLFIGASIGANIVAAMQIGAKKFDELHNTVHTSILLSFFIGVGVTLVGTFFTEFLLTLTNTPERIMDLTISYVRVYFLGVPGVLIYNFGSALLRAKGDTKRPLYILFIAGILNIILNLIFVLLFNGGVIAVAVATIISQYLTAVFILRCLIKENGFMKLDLSNLKIHRETFKKLVRIGLPAGLQNACFSLSNTVVQAAINTFGEVLIAGNTAASNIEFFIYTSFNAFYQAGVSFTSQNYGAQKYDRIMPILRYCMFCGVLIGVVGGWLTVIFGRELLGLFSTDSAVIEAGMIRIVMLMSVYGICAVMDTMAGPIRGMGYSIMPMAMTLIGSCFLRILWIIVIMNIPGLLTIEMVYLAFPVTWLVTILGHVICLVYVIKKLKEKIRDSVKG